MTNGKKIQWALRITAGAVLLAVTAGCQADKTDSGVAIVHGEQFVPYDAERPVYQFNTMESANAAHADATLRIYHFDGTALNSLGEERLDLILRNGDAPTPLVVYLDVPAEDSRTESRRHVVTAFLKDRGLTDEQIELKLGPNPDSNSPVVPLASASGGAAPAASAGGASSSSSGH